MRSKDGQFIQMSEAEIEERERREILALQDQARSVFDCLQAKGVDTVGDLMGPLRTDAEVARWYNDCAKQNWPLLSSDMGRLYVSGFLPYTSWVGIDTDFWLEVYRSAADPRLCHSLNEVFLKLPYYDKSVEAVLIELFSSTSAEAWEKQTYCNCLTEVNYHMPKLAPLLLHMLPDLDKLGAEALGHIGGASELEPLRAARDAAFSAGQIPLEKKLGRAISRIKRRIKEEAKDKLG